MQPQPPMDRFLVLSLLEDLQFPPPPEDPLNPGLGSGGAGTTYDQLFPASPTGAGVTTTSPTSTSSDASSFGTSSQKDSNLLTAGEQADGAEESCERQLARVRAIGHLPALARKMGPRWLQAELIPYLLRCCEEDSEPLGFAVAKVLPSLVGLSVVSVPKPPMLASSQRSVSKDNEAGGAAADDSISYTFSSRSQHALERALTVTPDIVRDTINHTAFFPEMAPPPTAPPATTPGTPPPPTPAFTNVPSQLVLTPDHLAPVLLALCGLRSQLVRNYVVDVTIPSVCFGVPFSLHFPLNPIVPTGGAGGGGAAKGGIILPPTTTSGASVDEAVTSLSDLGADTPFGEMLQLSMAVLQDCKAKKGDYAGSSSASLSQLRQLLLQQCEDYGANTSSASASFTADPFVHVSRRRQLHDAVNGAMRRQAKIFAPHSHAYCSSSSSDDDSSQAAVGSGGLFNALLDALLTAPSGTNCTSMFGGGGGGDGSSSSAAFASSQLTSPTNAPWPYHLAGVVRLMGNVIKLLTCGGVEYTKEKVGLLGRVLVNGLGGGSGESADKQQASSLSLSLQPLLPPAASTSPYTPFEERTLIASFVQETVPFEHIMGAIKKVHGAVFDSRDVGGAVGGGGGLASRTQSDIGGGGVGVGAAVASARNDHSEALNPLAELEGLLQNPFIAMPPSASTYSFSPAKVRLRYPLHVLAIEAALEALVPSLAMKEHCKLVEKLMGGMVGFGGGSAAVVGYCGLPRVQALLASPSATTLDTSGNHTNGSSLLTAMEPFLLSVSDVSSIIFELTALPIPTASGALSSAAAAPPSGWASSMLMIAGAAGMGAISAEAAALFGGNNTMGMSASANGSYSDRPDGGIARGAGTSGSISGYGYGGGSVSRQPSMQPALTSGRMGGGVGSSNNGLSSTGSREPKTMFGVVAAARTSASGLAQLLEGGGTSTAGTPWNIPTNSSGGSGSGSNVANISPAVAKERLQLICSRSFAAHYHTIAALCCGLYCVVSKRYGHLMGLTLAVVGATQRLANANATAAVSSNTHADPHNQQMGRTNSSLAAAAASNPLTLISLLALKATIRQLPCLLLCAKVGVIKPFGYYIAWRARYIGAVWMPAVSSAVGLLVSRMASLVTSIAPISNNNSSSSPSAAVVVQSFYSLLKDCVLLWQQPSAAATVGGQHTATTINKVTLTEDDYSRLAPILANEAWPCVKGCQHAIVGTLRALTSDTEEEVLTVAVERLMVTKGSGNSGGGGENNDGGGSGDASSANDGSSSSTSGASGDASLAIISASPTIPSVATSLFAMTLAMTPLAELDDALREAAAERAKHNSHRVQQQQQNQASSSPSSPSFLPSGTATMWSQILSYEILDLVNAALGKNADGSSITSSSSSSGSGVGGLPPNVAERTRAVVPIGLTQLLRDRWAYGYKAASVFSSTSVGGGGSSSSQPRISFSPITWYVSSSKVRGQLSSSSALLATSPANEEDLRYIHYRLTEDSKQKNALFTADYTTFRERCSRLLASLAQDKGALVQIGIVNAMLQLLASSSSSSSTAASGAGGGSDADAPADGGKPSSANTLATVSAAANVSLDSPMSPTSLQAVADAQQPSALDRGEMELFVSEMCTRLVKADVWRVREAFGVTLAKTIVAYTLPAVLL